VQQHPGGSRSRGATGRVSGDVADAVEADGHQVVRLSHPTGVDVVTGNGLAEALAGAEAWSA
jgi:hypothetical protein